MYNQDTPFDYLEVHRHEDMLGGFCHCGAAVDVTDWDGASLISCPECGQMWRDVDMPVTDDEMAGSEVGEGGGSAYKFSQTSLDRLWTCHGDLAALFCDVIKNYDCSIICGHRNAVEQNEAYAAGASKLQWPESRHNTKPSEAVDVAPYPIDWANKKRFYHFAGYVKAKAESMDIPIRWGGDWDSDNDLDDQHFMDLVHFELR